MKQTQYYALFRFKTGHSSQATLPCTLHTLSFIPRNTHTIHDRIRPSHSKIPPTLFWYGHIAERSCCWTILLTNKCHLYYGAWTMCASVPPSWQYFNCVPGVLCQAESFFQAWLQVEQEEDKYDLMIFRTLLLESLVLRSLPPPSPPPILPVLSPLCMMVHNEYACQVGPLWVILYMIIFCIPWLQTKAAGSHWPHVQSWLGWAPVGCRQ